MKEEISCSISAHNFPQYTLLMQLTAHLETPATSKFRYFYIFV